MKEKKQRTVYRMTLVKAFNMDDLAELEGYVELIELGSPDFIEIKAVTYCGKSDASSLTMQNVPWHREVCLYAEQICALVNKRKVSVPLGLIFYLSMPFNFFF
jgi:tRNA wybutosine-synthesizing protein 1